jgi:hypothetical protein
LVRTASASSIISSMPGLSTEVILRSHITEGHSRLCTQKLEEQNPQFFQAYYTRLKLKDQIVLFNHLLDQQVNIVSHCQNAWRQQQAHMAAQAAAAQQAQPGVALQGMPGMQPAVSLSAPTSQPSGSAAGAAMPASGAVSASAAMLPHGDSGGGGFSSGGGGGIATPDLADLSEMQVSFQACQGVDLIRVQRT